jgi:paraquat-inducible protein B
MPGENNSDGYPSATAQRKRFRISVVWIIPILAAVVAIGIAVQRIRNAGPQITLVVATASGIEAGKTFIKYKDVTIGQVTAVQLSDDYSKVIVTAQISKHASRLIVEDAKFWVVSPQISLSGISGLNTLLSGQYIGFQAGTSLKPARHFDALEVAPVNTGQPGSQLILTAKTLGSLGIGAPIYYRSIPVGKVEAYKLAADGMSIEARMFINAPYDKFISSETRFWNASGIEASLGANGVEVRTESLVSVLVGGLAFDTPNFAPVGAPVAANQTFTLYPSRAIAMAQPESEERHFALYFDESLRGLSTGAPVTLFGLPVGLVTDVGLSYDPATLSLRPRVLVTFYPERLIERLSDSERPKQGPGGVAGILPEARAPLLRHLVEDRGLRAQLQSGNLLTGEMYVAFDYIPNAPKVKVDWKRDPLEFPVASGGLATIEAKLSSILTKVDNMPLDAIGGNVKDVLANLNQTLKEAETLIGRVDAQWVPEGTKTIADLHNAIADADRSFLGRDAATAQDLHTMLQELTNTARAVRVFVDYLQQHPAALIRGKKKESP